MATHQISVTVEKDSILVEPDTLVMTSADEVRWAGTNARAFSIVFDDDRAFGKREMAYNEATTQQRAQAKGRFKYSVVSAEDRGLTLDPVIIVEDPPTGPSGP